MKLNLGTVTGSLYARDQAASQFLWIAASSIAYSHGGSVLTPQSAAAGHGPRGGGVLDNTYRPEDAP